MHFINAVTDFRAPRGVRSGAVLPCRLRWDRHLSCPTTMAGEGAMLTRSSDPGLGICPRICEKQRYGTYKYPRLLASSTTRYFS